MGRRCTARPATASAGLSTRPGRSTRPPTELAEQVLALAATVPSGRATTYGEIAEAIGRPRAARAVGNAMAEHGGDVAWWRVVRADGSPPRNGPTEALRRLADEGCPLTADGTRVDLHRALFDLPVAEGARDPHGASTVDPSAQP